MEFPIHNHWGWGDNQDRKGIGQDTVVLTELSWTFNKKVGQLTSYPLNTH